MRQTDKIAILLATYNGEAFLREQIASIEAQTASGWTVYFHDDGSTDGTMEIIRAYTAADPDRFQYIDGPATGGAKNNFFYLLGQVDAPYYFFCDQDDIWERNKVEVTHRRMLKAASESGKSAAGTAAMSYTSTGAEVSESGRSVAGPAAMPRPAAGAEVSQAECGGAASGNRQIPCLVFTELRVVGTDKNVIADRMSSYQALDCTNLGINRMLIQNVVTGCTMEINHALRDMMQKAGNLDDIIMHDWWAALIASWCGRMEFIPEPTINYRQHTGNSVGALAIHDKKYLLKRIRQGRQIRESLSKTRKQAAAFAGTFELPADTLPAQYARSGEWNKIRRMCFYRKYDIKKTGKSRRIGQLIWG
jgi:glycosyltransferase involved in cell wall biosynthesis